VRTFHIDPELASLRPSLLRLRPHTVDLSIPPNVLVDRHIAALASMVSIRALTLDVDHDDKSTGAAARITRDSDGKKVPIDYAPLAKLQKLTTLKLAVGLWTDVAPLLNVLGSQLTTLTIDNNIYEARTCDMSCLLQCTRLTSLDIRDLVVFPAPLGTFRLLPHYASQLATMTLCWGEYSHLHIDLSFLTSFTCLKTLTLDTGRRTIRGELKPLPFLHSLDISSTRIPLTTFTVTPEAPLILSVLHPQSPPVGWASLTRLSPYPVFEVEALRWLPRSLIELDLRHTFALHDTFVDLLLGTTIVSPQNSCNTSSSSSSSSSLTPTHIGLLPPAMKRIIFPKNALIVAAKAIPPAAVTDRTACHIALVNIGTSDIIERGERQLCRDEEPTLLLHKLNPSSKCVNDIIVTFV
jgi:hypothetical protein